jgi:hypothetical protein
MLRKTSNLPCTRDAERKRNRWHVANDLAIIRLVLDHQNALPHGVSTCRSTITGSVKANVEP